MKTDQKQIDIDARSQETLTVVRQLSEGVLKRDPSKPRKQRPAPQEYSRWTPMFAKFT